MKLRFGRLWRILNSNAPSHYAITLRSFILSLAFSSSSSCFLFPICKRHFPYSDNILHLFTWAQSIRFAIKYFHFLREFFFSFESIRFFSGIIFVFLFLAHQIVPKTKLTQIQIDTYRNGGKKCRNSFLFVPFCVLVLSKIEKKRKKSESRWKITLHWKITAFIFPLMNKTWDKNLNYFSIFSHFSYFFVQLPTSFYFFLFHSLDFYV